jgi:hypothetical protein
MHTIKSDGGTDIPYGVHTVHTYQGSHVYWKDVGAAAMLMHLQFRGAPKVLRPSSARFSVRLAHTTPTPAPSHPVLVCLNKLLRREYRRRQRSRGSRSCGICQTNSTYKVTYMPALVLKHLFQNFAIDTLPALVARCLRPLRLSLDDSSGMQTNLSCVHVSAP